MPILGFAGAEVVAVLAGDGDGDLDGGVAALLAGGGHAGEDEQLGVVGVLADGVAGDGGAAALLGVDTLVDLLGLDLLLVYPRGNVSAGDGDGQPTPAGGVRLG